jgi:hypothetical protein
MFVVVVAISFVRHPTRTLIALRSIPTIAIDVIACASSSGAVKVTHAGMSAFAFQPNSPRFVHWVALIKIFQIFNPKSEQTKIASLSKFKIYSFFSGSMTKPERRKKNSSNK